MAKKDASEYLGGLSGKAGKALRTRAQRLKELEDYSMGVSSNKTQKKKKAAKKGY